MHLLPDKTRSEIRNEYVPEYWSPHAGAVGSAKDRETGRSAAHGPAIRQATSLKPVRKHRGTDRSSPHDDESTWSLQR